MRRSVEPGTGGAPRDADGAAPAAALPARRGRDALAAIALTTGILSGLWSWTAVLLGLPAWAGFLGCTSYFAAPKGGGAGLRVSVATNLSGVFWAMVIIRGSEYAGMDTLGYGIVAIVAVMMCIQAKQTWLAYIPGTFIGACATFAADAAWQLVIPALMLGGLFGYLMKTSGLWLHRRLST